MEAIITYAEVVAEFVEDRLPHLLDDLFVVRAHLFDGLLVDADLVGAHKVVVAAAFSDGNTVIETEKCVPGPNARCFFIERGGARFDDDVDVLNAAQEFGRDERNSVADEAAEVRAFQC